MSNSKLVEYTKISPNSSNPRKGKIKKITLHIVAGKITLQTLGNIFAPRSRKASSNYGVDNNGKVGMYVEEKNRAWTSSSAKNDNEAVTIEVVNSKSGGNWPVSDAALEGTINLCVDICKRNGIKELIYDGTKNGTLTRHNMFAATLCPGPYLQSKFPYIAKEVNKRLGTGTKPVTSTPTSKPPVTKPASNNIAVDGYWGNGTTKALQKALGTTVDGIISGQYQNSVTKAITSCDFRTNTGSNVIRSLQRKIGVKADGYIGPQTIRALQKYLGTYQDGIISRPSNVVRALQRRLNQGNF